MISKNTRVIIGTLLIIAGVIAFGNVLGVWSMAKITKSWWTVLIIIPFLTEILIRGIKLWNTTGLTIGVLFLLAELGVYSIFAVLSVAFPVCLAVLGVVFIVDR